ncbi:MAG: hypothetical protein IPK79_04435 [Vampirovibrionales bacterium]|nr:hypothetical protein [Vampirovibrionales bacterium]
MRARQRFRRHHPDALNAQPPASMTGGLFALALALLFAGPALADSRRLVVAQGADLSMQVRLDPSLAPDAQILRYPSRMVILLPDKAFPEGFAAGTLRVDPASRPRVSIARQNGATAVTIRGDRVGLGLQDLSRLESSAGPGSSGLGTTGSAANGASPPSSADARSAPGAPSAGVQAAKPATALASPLALLAQVLPVSSPSPQKASRAIGAPSARAAVSSAPQPSNRRSLFSQTPPPQTAQAAPAPAETASSEPLVPPLTQTPSQTAPQPQSVEALPSGSRLDDVPLSALIGGREPLLSNATLIRMALGLLIALGLVVGVLRYGLPRWRGGSLLQSGQNSAQRHGWQAMAPRSTPSQSSRSRPPRPSSRPPLLTPNAGESARHGGGKPPGRASSGGGLLGVVRDWLERRRQAETQRQREAVRQMNPAFDILETRELGGGKTLHRVDLWGRQLIIATSPRTISLLAVLDDEGHDLYFNDAQAENGRLLAQMVGERDALRDIFRQAERHWTPVADLPEFAQTQPVERANRAVRLEATFDDLYRKYLNEPSGETVDDASWAESGALLEDEPMDGDPEPETLDSLARACLSSQAASGQTTSAASLSGKRPLDPANPANPAHADEAITARAPRAAARRASGFLPATPALAPARAKRPEPTPPASTERLSASDRPRRDRPPTPPPQPMASPRRQPDDWIVLADYEDEFESDD